MKFLRNIFDNAHAKLNKSEKTKKWFPLVDAFDTLMFTPNHVTKNGAHIRDAIDLKRTMMFVIISMIPCLLFGIYNAGHWAYVAEEGPQDFLHNFGPKLGFGAIKVIPIVAVSYISGLFIEFIFAIRNGHAVQEGFLVSGMLIPLIMPVDVPLWMVAIATMFAVLIGKEIFGGTGMNILNIALTARAFLFFAHPTSMSGDKTWVAGIKELKEDGVNQLSGATSLGDLASAKSFINEKAAEEVDVTTTEITTAVADMTSNVASMMDSFYGLEIGCVGETSALLCLIGAIFLIFTGIGSWKIMGSFFVGGLAIASVFHYGIGGNPFYEIDPIHQLMLGGFMFGMVFMATDPVSAAQTSTGKYIYGFTAGALGILIRMGNAAYPEGIMLGILIANVCAPTIDHMVIKANINKRLKRLKTA